MNPNKKNIELIKQFNLAPHPEGGWFREIIRSKEDIENSARKIIGLGARAVLIKGGGLKDMKGKDFFLDLNGRKEWLINNFINTKNTHGSGCTLSAAICGYKALGFDLFDSIQKAKLFVEKSLENSYKIGSGPGPLGHH